MCWTSIAKSMRIRKKRQAAPNPSRWRTVAGSWALRTRFPLYLSLPLALCVCVCVCVNVLYVKYMMSTYTHAHARTHTHARRQCCVDVSRECVYVCARVRCRRTHYHACRTAVCYTTHVHVYRRMYLCMRAVQENTLPCLLCCCLSDYTCTHIHA